MASFVDAAPPRGGRVVLVAVLVAMLFLVGAALVLSLTWDGPPDPHGSRAHPVPIQL